MGAAANNECILIEILLWIGKTINNNDTIIESENNSEIPEQADHSIRLSVVFLPGNINDGKINY